MGARHQKNVEKIFLFWEWNFFKISGRKAGAERKLTTFFKSFLQKKFELRSIKIPSKNFPKILRFFLRRFAKIASVCAVWRALRAWTVEVRLPCDFKRNSVSVSPTARLALPKSEKEFLLSFQMWYIEIATN